MNFLLETAFGVSLVQSWGAAILYSILLVITLFFLIAYIKRMLIICFLIIIAPLITITYSIDKSGNNKSEILNTWMKEFCYNVLIQPFHCITYMIFAGSAMELMYTAKPLNFGAAIFAIACILCLFVGEKMIRSIFGFNKSKSVAQKIFTGSMVTSAISNIRTINKANEQEEEPAPPSVMPDGTNTKDEIASMNSKVKLTQTETIEESSENKGNKKKQEAKLTGNSKKETNKKQTAKKKENGKIKLLAKDVGRAYVRGVSSRLGYEKYQNMQERAQKKKMPSTQEQFLIASENYRRSVNPRMTNKQLARQMEAIMKTPMKDLKDSRDVLYKSWITHMQKNLTAQGEKDPAQAMKNSIENKR